MKILFLTPWYPDDLNPNHGIFIRNQAAAVAANHEVHLISSKINYTSFGICSFKVTSGQYDKIAEHRVSVKRSLPIYNQLNYFFISVWFTIKIVRRVRPDVIHGNIGYPGAFWTWCVSRICKIPFVISEHTRVIHNFRSFIHRWLTVFSMRKAAAILAVSNILADEIKSIVHRVPLIVPNMVMIDNFRMVTPHPHGEVCQIGFLGGMNTPIKGFDVLLKALAPIKKKFMLHVGGEGKLVEQYKLLAGELGVIDRCVFYGFVLHKDVPEFMGRLNFLVSASRYESFGLTILESIACGIPVVATRCGGPEDFVTEDFGLMVQPENADALQEGISRMVDSYSSYDPQRMKAYVADGFSPAVIGGKLEAIYREILNRRSGKVK